MKKNMDTNECRKMIWDSMSNAGYADREIQMFLAGATIMGYLADNRASWAREHLTKKFFSFVDPWDPRIDQAGEKNLDWEKWEAAKKIEEDKAKTFAELRRVAEAKRRARQADEKREARIKRTLEP
jgi:hypothetical protein